MTRTIFLSIFFIIMGLVQLVGCKDASKKTDYLIKKMDYMKKNMALNEKQTKLYTELRESMFTDIKTHLKNRKSFVKNIRAELSKEVPEMKKVAKRIKNKASERSQMVSRNVDKFMALYARLNPEQKQKANKYVARLIYKRGHH